MKDSTENQEPEDSTAALNSWAKPPSLANLKADLTEAQAAHDEQVSKIDVWLDNLHIRNKAVPQSPEGSSSVQPRLIRKQAEWRYPSLSEPFVNTPELFSASPVTWEDKKSAEQNQLVLNNQMNTKINKIPFIDEYVRCAVDEGTAIVRLGWDFEEEEFEEQEPIYEFQHKPEMAQIHQELAAMKIENPTGYRFEVPPELRRAHEESAASGSSLEARVVDYITVKKFKTVRNQPTVELCDYNNVTLDPSCKGDIDKAGFLVYSFETSMSALKKEKNKYSNLDEIKVDNNTILGTPDHVTKESNDFNFKDNARKLFIAHEYWGYWDYNDTGIAEPFVATWVGNVLIRMEENPFPDKKIPWVFVPMLPVKGSAYGEPDGALLEDNQKIVGAVTRGMIDILAKSANGQTGARKDALDTTNRRKFQNGQDYEYNQGVDPRMAFYMHTYAEIPQSAPLMIQMQNQDAESLTGVKAFDSGISSDSLGQVAAGIRGALDAASKRETSILRRLAAGMERIGRKIISMNQAFLDEEEIIRVTNSQFVPVRRDDLGGRIDLRLTISTAEEDNAKAQELAFMLQTLGPNAEWSMIKIVLIRIAKLRRMPELAKEIEDYAPEPDPMQQQVQQMEIAKLEAEIEEIKSRTVENYSEAELDMAKAETEGAKARNTASLADKTDLEFLDQESGVTHARDKEKLGAQAAANEKLETHKANLADQSKQLDAQDLAIERYLDEKNQEN